MILTPETLNRARENRTAAKAAYYRNPQSCPICGGVVPFLSVCKGTATCTSVCGMTLAIRNRERNALARIGVSA